MRMRFKYLKKHSEERGRRERERCQGKEDIVVIVGFSHALAYPCPFGSSTLTLHYPQTGAFQKGSGL